MAAVSTGVCIDGENFYLVTLPAPSSTLVKNAKKNLLGALDLERLVADLGKLGNFIPVAYNGIAGNTDLQRIVYKIIKLTDKTVVTVHNFQGASKYVLQELQGTYQYLLDGLEEMALETLSLLPNVAEQMAKSAEKLRDDFESASRDVIDALEEKQKAKGVQEEKQVEFNGKNNEDIKNQSRKEKEEIRIKQKQAEAIVRDYTENEEKLRRYYAEAGNNALLALGGEGSVCMTEAIAKAHEERLVLLQKIEYLRSYKQDAIRDCIEFTQRLKNCEEDDITQVAKDALHNSIGALKSLSAIMMKAASFWRQQHNQANMLSQIEKAMKYPEEKRVKVWTSKGFKTKAVQSYSKWVALDDVCETYMPQIKEKSGDLYAYLEENPATTFKDDLEKNTARAIKK